MYAAYRFTTSTIIGDTFKNELYGIRTAHIENGFKLNVSKKGPMQKLTKIRRAWTKERISGQRTRKPITSAILARFLTILRSDDYDHQTLRGLLCFAKFGLLRVSEYSYGSNGNAPLVGQLSIVPSMEEPSFLVYRFQKSKTNQFGKHERIVCACTCPGPCAVHEVVRMLSMRAQVRATDKLFCFKDGTSPTDDHIRNLIKRLCALCGMDHTKFASHQLRSGGVTDLLCNGVPDSIIQLLARWANLDSMVPYKIVSDHDLAKLVAQVNI